MSIYFDKTGYVGVIKTAREGVDWEDIIPYAKVNTGIPDQKKAKGTLARMCQALANETRLEVRYNLEGINQGHYFRPKVQKVEIFPDELLHRLFDKHLDNDCKEVEEGVYKAYTMKKLDNKSGKAIGEPIFVVEHFPSDKKKFIVGGLNA